MESFNSHSSIKNLKKNSVERILIGMLEDIKNGDKSKGRPEVPFLILIVDEYTAKIISSFVSMSDVLNKGIFSVEKLEMGRQKFPNYQALYFVSPTKTSVERIIKDFEDKANPQYKRIHIFFSHHVMDSTLNVLANERLFPRILSCKELNLSFLCKNKNLYELGVNEFLDIFSSKNDRDKERDRISTLTERLFCVLSVLREYPYIQFQKSSNFCSELASNLNVKLKDFYNSPDGQIPNVTRGLMLITDRTLDLCTPLLHDYTYESLIYDIIEPEKLVIKTGADKNTTKKVELDETDELWNKYKNSHIAEVFEKVSNEFKEFYDKDVSKNNNSNFKDFDAMRSALRDAKSLKVKSEMFTFHVEICGEMINKLKELDISNIIDYEQDILTGLNKNGDKVSNKDVFTKFTTLNLNKKELDLKTRILLAIIINIDLTESELNRLSENNTHIKKIIENLSWFGINVSKTKGKTERRTPEKSKQEIKKLLDKNSEGDFVGLRSSPKLESIVESWSNLELAISNYPFVEEPRNLGDYRKKISTGVLFNNANSDEEKPNFILFNIGGLSHNEIASIEKLTAEKKVTQNLILGTDKIITANDYINAIKNLPSQGLDVTDVDLRFK